MKQYRRRETSDTWHLNRNCSNWPTSNYKPYSGFLREEGSNRPTDGEFCNECKAKAKPSKKAKPSNYKKKTYKRF